MPTIADVLQSTMDLVNLFDGREDEMRDWWAGTATGGFNADGTPSDGIAPHGGYYPMSDSAGVTIYFPCIAKLASVMQKGDNASQDISFSFPGIIGQNELIQLYSHAGVNTTIDPSQSVGACDPNLASDVVLSLTKNGTAWGTVTYHAGVSPTVTFNFSNTTLNHGDVVRVYGPATYVATFLNPTFTLAGSPN